MSETDHKKPEREAERIVHAANRDSHTVFTGALHQLAKMSGLSAGKNGVPEDPVEKWGRLVGRTLGLVFLLLLTINLFTGKIF